MPKRPGFNPSGKTISKKIQPRDGLKKDGRKRGRPPKSKDLKYRSVSIRLHPAVLRWLHEEAARRGVGYQTVINDVLLKRANDSTQ